MRVVKRRKDWAARVEKYRQTHTVAETAAHFDVHPSTIYATRAGPRKAMAKAVIKLGDTPPKPISHTALLYLRSAKRAGPTAKGHLLAMLALEELEGR